MKGRKLLVIGGVGLVVIAAVAGFFVFKPDKQPETPPNEVEQTPKERLSIATVDELKNGANDEADAFRLMTSTASILQNSGDPDGAEEYYLAALDHAKKMQDQELIDTGYRYLLAYYKSTGKDDKYNSITAELGEEGVKRVLAPDPRDGEQPQ